MTVYANLVDGELKGVYDLIPEKWNGIDNFHLKCKVDQNFMHENGFVKIIRDNTAYNPETHRMSDFPWYTVENGEVIEHRDIFQIPVPTREELLEGIRHERDRRIKDFEWRYERYNRENRLGLTPTDSLLALDTYVQALADITNQEDLKNILWPVFNEQ